MAHGHRSANFVEAQPIHLLEVGPQLAPAPPEGVGEEDQFFACTASSATMTSVKNSVMSDTVVTPRLSLSWSCTFW